MRKKLNRNFGRRSSSAQSTFPYLHRVVSDTESKKYINLLRNQSDYNTTVETLHTILAQTNFDTSDQALVALTCEYYRLACLTNLSENDSQRMLMILSFAEIDTTLSNLINAIDAFLASQTMLNNLLFDSTFV